MTLRSLVLLFSVCALWYIVFIICFGASLIGTVATLFMYYRPWRLLVAQEFADSDVIANVVEPEFHDAESFELLPVPGRSDGIALQSDLPVNAQSNKDCQESTSNSATVGITKISDLPKDVLVCVTWPLVTASHMNFSEYIRSMACIRSVCRSWRHSAESTSDFRDYKESWADHLLFLDRR